MEENALGPLDLQVIMKRGVRVFLARYSAEAKSAASCDCLSPFHSRRLGYLGGACAWSEETRSETIFSTRQTRPRYVLRIPLEP